MLNFDDLCIFKSRPLSETLLREDVMNAFADEQTVWAYAIPDRQWIPMPDRLLLIGLWGIPGMLRIGTCILSHMVRVSHTGHGSSVILNGLNDDLSMSS